MMNCRSYQLRIFFGAARNIIIRLRPAWVFAATFIALSLVAGSSVAQKNIDPPDNNTARELAQRPRPESRNDAGQDISRLYRQYTVELAPDCSQEALHAYIREMAAAGQLKQAPVQMGSRIGILVQEAAAHDLTAAPCVKEITPGWQPSASPELGMLALGEDKMPEVPEQTAVAAGTGTISGTVTAETSGAALLGISVCADYDNGSYWESAGCTASDADGNYQISALEAGAYRILFTDTGGDYAWEFYDSVQDEDDAETVLVVDGSTTSGINASLAERGHISGTVTAEVDGALLSDIYICAYLGGQNGDWQAWIGCEYSDAQGQYDIGYLPGGVYRVDFYDPTGVYLREFYDDAVDIDSATDIIVTTGNTTFGINAALPDAGHITGTVTAEYDGLPLEFIDVCAYKYTGAFWLGAGCGSTDAAGFYDIGGLATGDYRVSFSDSDDGYYLSEYYENAADIESAVNVGVTAGAATAEIDAVLSEPGHIAGKATVYPSGVPLEAVEACAYVLNDADWLDVGCDVTDVSGDYDIGDLPPGTYRVGFSDLFEFYVGEFYDDVLDIEDAVDVSVTSGIITLGINAALIEGGRITGTIMAEDGSPLQDIAACGHRYDGANWQWVGCGYSEADGGYTISGLPDGTYRVEFYDWYAGIYHGEFYDDAPDLDSAADVAVTAGSTTTGIHAALIEFGHISGTVTAEFGGAPLSDIEICTYIFTGSNWEWLRCVTSDANGEYDIGGLDSGAYRLGFVDYGGDYLTEFYSNAADVNGAADIYVTLGRTTDGIDAALRDYGHITGMVTDESSGAPLADVRVCSYSYQVSLESHWRAGRCALTNAGGVYDIGGLTADDYRLGFFDSTGNYGFKYYQNSPDINGALNLSVSDDSTLSEIDAALTGVVPAPPLNDDIDSAIAAQSFPYQSIFDVRHATTAVDDPDFTCQPNDQGYGSVWYAVTPDQASILRANTFGSNYDTVLGIWEGTRGSLSSLSCNDNASGTQSQTTAGPLAGGVTHYVEVAGYDSELFELVLNLDLVPDTPFADCVSDTGSSASFNIPASAAVNGSLNLTPGDEFALLTPDGSVCAGHGAWTGSDLNITAWGDEPQTQETDGFVDGDEIRILIWDFSNDTIFIVTNVTYSYTSHGEDTFKAGENFVVASLEVAPRVTQRIALSSGWNLISSYVAPEYPDLEMVMAGVESKMILMKNGAGDTYWPDQSINEIGDWDVRDGYQIYMTGSATLRVTGAAVEPDQTPISMFAGWNIIAYLRSAPQPVDQALSSISNQLVLAKNSHGEIYWPAFNVNQIGAMQSGAGYKVYLSGNGTLTYPSNE